MNPYILNLVVQFLLCHPDCAGVFIDNDSGYVMPSIIATPDDRKLPYISRTAILPRF